VGEQVGCLWFWHVWSDAVAAANHVQLVLSSGPVQSRSVAGCVSRDPVIRSDSSPVQELRLELQYFYDEDKTTFEIVDLKFPSAQRGIAVGAIVATRPQADVSHHQRWRGALVLLLSEPAVHSFS